MEKKKNKFNQCWIYEKLIHNDGKKVRDHCHVTGQLRGELIGIVKSSLTKNVSVIFHKLKSYDSHLIFNELNRFNVNIDVIPNALEKYVAFFLNKNLVFIDSMQFMNSSLDKLFKNLSNNDFK